MSDRDDTTTTTPSFDNTPTNTRTMAKTASSSTENGMRRRRQAPGKRNPKAKKEGDDEDAALDAALKDNGKHRRGGFSNLLAMVALVGLVVLVVLMAFPFGSSGGRENENDGGKASSNRDLSARDDYDKGIAQMTGNHKILATYDHDPSAFTQGLTIVEEGEYNNETDSNKSLNLVESTGMYGESVVRVWDPASGKVFKEQAMDSKYFGEGLTAFSTSNNQTFYMVLTYK